MRDDAMVPPSMVCVNRPWFKHGMGRALRRWHVLREKKLGTGFVIFGFKVVVGLMFARPGVVSAMTPPLQGWCLKLLAVACGGGSLVAAQTGYTPAPTAFLTFEKMY